MKSSQTLLKEVIGQQLLEVQRAPIVAALGEKDIYDLFKPLMGFLRLVFRRALATGYSAMKGIELIGQELMDVYTNPLKKWDKKSWGRERRRAYNEILGPGYEGVDLFDLESCMSSPALCLAGGVFSPGRTFRRSFMGARGATESLQGDVSRLLFEVAKGAGEIDADTVEMLEATREENFQELIRIEREFRIVPTIVAIAAVAAARSVEEILDIAGVESHHIMRDHLQSVIDTVQEGIAQSNKLEDAVAPIEAGEFEPMLLGTLKKQIISALINSSGFVDEIEERKLRGQGLENSPLTKLYVGALNKANQILKDIG